MTAPESRSQATGLFQTNLNPVQNNSLQLRRSQNIDDLVISVSDHQLDRGLGVRLTKKNQRHFGWLAHYSYSSLACLT